LVAEASKEILHNDSQVINDTSVYKITGENALSAVI